MKTLMTAHPILGEVAAAREVAWVNPDRMPFVEAIRTQALTMADIEDAENRLKRFAPFIRKCFPETECLVGIIESELVEIPDMRMLINSKELSNN